MTTTMQPDRPITVTKAEWTDLKRSGLLEDDGTGHDIATSRPGPTTAAAQTGRKQRS